MISIVVTVVLSSYYLGLSLWVPVWVQNCFQLLQPTIERLLPADEGDDEGYELSSVLNKTIGPLECIVTAVQDRHVNLQQIQLLH